MTTATATAVVPNYRYRASLTRAIDGDTYELDIDLGLKVHAIVAVRLRGVDCPEMSTPLGEAARLAAERLLQSAGVIVVQTYKDHQSFARWIADVYIDGAPLAEQLRALGHVKGKS